MKNFQKSIMSITTMLLKWAKDLNQLFVKVDSYTDGWPGPDRECHLVGPSSCAPEGCGFDSQSGPIPTLWISPLVGGVQEATKRFFSHWCSSLCLSVYLSVSLKSIKTYPWLRIKNKKKERWPHLALGGADEQQQVALQTVRLKWKDQQHQVLEKL